MAFTFVDGLGNTVYSDASGDGSLSFPHQQRFRIGGVDNPIPVSFPSPQQVVFPFPQPISHPPIWIPAASYNATNSLIVKSSTGTLQSISVDNNSAFTRYLLFFNQNTLPTTNQTPPSLSYTIPANSIRDIGSDLLGIGGVLFNLGIVWCWSTSRNVYIPPNVSNENAVITMYT